MAPDQYGYDDIPRYPRRPGTGRTNAIRIFVALAVAVGIVVVSLVLVK